VALAAHGPRRVSPAPDPLAASTEWVLGLNGSIGALSSHSQGQVTASMTGEIAYASCTAGTRRDRARSISVTCRWS
jgi:hypothetical protein